MSTNIQSRVTKGVSTGGEFAKEHKSEATGITLAARPSDSTRVRAPEGQFSAADANTDWGREAIRAGALRRFGVTGEDLDNAAALVNDGMGGRQKARDSLGLNDRQLDELVATKSNLRDHRAPHFINGEGSRKDWAALTASGLGQVPLEPTGEASTYRIPAPAGRDDTVRITEDGMLELTDREGNTTETDGEGINRLLDERNDQRQLDRYEKQFGAKPSYDAQAGTLRVEAGGVAHMVGRDWEFVEASNAPGQMTSDMQVTAKRMHESLVETTSALSESRRTPNRQSDKPLPVTVDTFTPEPVAARAPVRPAKRTFSQRLGRLFGRR